VTQRDASSSHAQSTKGKVFDDHMPHRILLQP
jgi:hypothetical protein